MYTVITEFKNGMGKVGAHSAADARTQAERSRRNPDTVRVTILEGVTLDQPALRRVAKELARMYGTSRVLSGASPHWAMSKVLGTWALWGFMDEHVVGQRATRLWERYMRFRHHMLEVAPGWREVEQIHYVSGGIDSVQVAKDGRRRTRMIKPDRLD